LFKEALEFFKKIDKTYNVLFIEDNEETRLGTVTLLQNFLPNVISAKDGLEGIELYNNHMYSSDKKSFDLIISDIQMPKKDGLCMLSEIKILSPNIPVVIISAYDYSEYLLEAIEIGIDNYILKPYTNEKLINTLYTVLKKKQQFLNTKVLQTQNINKKQIFNLGHDYQYDMYNKVLIYKDTFIKISKNENLLFEVLIKGKGQSVSSMSIEYYIWDQPVAKHSLRALVYRIRAKVNHEIIETVSTFGYKINYSKNT